MKRTHIIYALVVLGSTLVPGRLTAQTDTTGYTGPDTVVFTPDRGKVTLAHRKHAEQLECVVCHHDSRPEKPLESPRQKCGACHTDPVSEPMKTDRRNAMHDTAAREGLCYSCHNSEAEAGKPVPDRCSDCHRRERMQTGAAVPGRSRP